MPCGVAFAGDTFMDTSAVFELGGLLCSFSIAFEQRKRHKRKF
jgi:hypothetical protein